MKGTKHLILKKKYSLHTQDEMTTDLKFQRSFGIFLEIFEETLPSVVFQLESQLSTLHSNQCQQDHKKTYIKITWPIHCALVEDCFLVRSAWKQAKSIVCTSVFTDVKFLVRSKWRWTIRGIHERTTNAHGICHHQIPLSYDWKRTETGTRHIFRGQIPLRNDIRLPCWLRAAKRLIVDPFNFLLFRWENASFKDETAP